MGTRARQKPKRLAAKLLAIRKHLKMSQTQIAEHLGIRATYHYISAYEHGTNEPTLMVLLKYSQLAGVHVEAIINDRISLTQFRNELRKNNNI